MTEEILRQVNRKCSCCGEAYTDEEGHDYEECVESCENRVEDARHNLRVRLECLEKARVRRQAQSEGRIK